MKCWGLATELLAQFVKIFSMSNFCPSFVICLCKCFFMVLSIVLKKFPIFVHIAHRKQLDKYLTCFRSTPLIPLSLQYLFNVQMSLSLIKEFLAHTFSSHALFRNNDSIKDPTHGIQAEIVFSLAIKGISSTRVITTLRRGILLTFSAGESKILSRFSHLLSCNLEGKKVLTRATDSEFP